MKDNPDIEDRKKEYLCWLIEMILRNKEKTRTKEKHSFIPYDLVFLKYIN